MEVPMTRLTTRLAAAALALSFTACASGPAAGPQTAPAAPLGSQAQVQVTNNNWSDMRVYVERSGMRQRLGTVTSMGTRTFDIPRTMLSGASSVRLIADPIGANQGFVSHPLQVSPGQQVNFTIENQMSISNISIWNR
jgi:hypothetical protein